LDLWTCGGGRCECGFVFVVVAACWSASRKHRFFRPDCSSSGLFVGRWNREVAWSWYQVLAFFFRQVSGISLIRWISVVEKKLCWHNGRVQVEFWLSFHSWRRCVQVMVLCD
jgi:hypothetical protein